MVPPGMMNLQQARVINPILTTVAQGYRNAERVGGVLFPTVPVQVRGGTVLEFGRESFALLNSVRAPGGDTMRIAFGYEGKPFVLKQEALDAPIPREYQQDAAAVPGVDLGTRAVMVVMGSLTLSLEHEQAQIATDPANYSPNNALALAGADCWSDPGSSPMKAIDDAKEQVRLSAGLDPNRMVVSKKIFNAMKNHRETLERFKYTSSESITAQMLAALYDLETLAVGKAVALESDAEGAPFVDIWGNCATLAYAPTEPNGFEEPSFGYTYTLDGNPFVEQPYWDGKAKSWIYGVTYERRPVLTGIASGFLFSNVLAAE